MLEIDMPDKDDQQRRMVTSKDEKSRDDLFRLTPGKLSCFPLTRKIRRIIVNRLAGRIFDVAAAVLFIAEEVVSAFQKLLDSPVPSVQPHRVRLPSDLKIYRGSSIYRPYRSQGEKESSKIASDSSCRYDKIGSYEFVAAIRIWSRLLRNKHVTSSYRQLDSKVIIFGVNTVNWNLIYVAIEEWYNFLIDNLLIKQISCKYAAFCH